MNLIIILQTILVIFLVCLLILIFKKNFSLKKEKRIGYYSLEPLKDKTSSYSDRIIKKYLAFVKKVRPVIKKVHYFEVSSRKYEKYIKYKNRDSFMPIDFITNKLAISLLFIILTVFSQVFSTKILGFYELLINYFIGYFLLDIYLYFDYKKQRKLIENELLRAVIIMNNAFKAGKSTMQAVTIASKELPEPICDEFKKMALDMKYGLSVDTVFDRFAKRVNVEEATYLSASLTILNKTGGNIVEVFSSIERTLFDKKKLNEELKNISASSNMIVKVLFAVPFVFVGIIYFLNPTYFSPLFNSILGYLIILIIVLMLVIYLFFLKKIMKVRV